MMKKEDADSLRWYKHCSVLPEEAGVSLAV